MTPIQTIIVRQISNTWYCRELHGSQFKPKHLPHHLSSPSPGTGAFFGTHAEPRTGTHIHPFNHLAYLLLECDLRRMTATGVGDDPLQAVAVKPQIDAGNLCNIEDELGTYVFGVGGIFDGWLCEL